MKQIKGKIRIVAKTGGLKLEGDNKRYNPANDKGKETILENKEKLLNSEVILTLDDNNKVIGYTIQEEEEEPEVEGVKEQKPQEPIREYDKRIIRQNALRHATNLVIAVFSALNDEDREKISISDLTKKTIEQAKTLEKWILGGGSDE